MRNRVVKIVLVTLLFLVSYSCSVTRKLSSGEYLLTKNSISIELPDSTPKANVVNSAELSRFIPLTQTPNKKIFGIPIFLGFYNLSNPQKDNWFHSFLRRIGEEPTLLDTTAVQSIAKEMGIYMSARGYWQNSISDTIIYKGKKAKVSYKIDGGEPFVISDIDYVFKTKAIEPVILADSGASLLKTGELLDRMVLDKERSRITEYMVDQGYYQFSTSDVNYLVDTLSSGRNAKVSLIIGANRGATTDPSKVFRIRNIYVNSNYNPSQERDTIAYDTVMLNGFNYILEKGKMYNINPKLLSEVITIYPNSIYSKEQIQYTSANISNLNFFKSANIIFKEVEQSSDDFITYIDGDLSDSTYQTPEGFIDCTILCSPAKKQNYNIDFEVATNSNYSSVALTVGYGNKNIFKRAETLNLSVSSSYDFMRSKSQRDSYQLGASASVAFPRLAVPKFVNRYKNLFGVSTTIDLSASFQQRPDYDRMLFNGSFGYRWSSSKFLSYTFKPINVSLIEVPWIRQSFLESIENPYLKNSYMSQMIFGMLGSFVYTNSSLASENTYTFRANGETSGNFLNLISNTFNTQKYSSDIDSYYKAFHVRYAQYVRADVDFSVKHNLNESGSTNLVYRIYMGGGYAYGNTSSLPRERLFYVGGSNSMRGWQVRTLGPGATPEIASATYPDQTGNIRLETNLEGRFNIWGPLNGALFLDLGNVWYNGKGEKDSVARLQLDSFLSELAFNTGVGARLDFGYFVLRLDWGIQLYNPGWAKNHRWIHDFKFDNTAIHFGIGYPF